MSDFQPVTNLPIDEKYREIVSTMRMESMNYNLRYEERPEGMEILHHRARELRIEPISMNPAVNRILLEYAGIKGLIDSELKKLTEAELREAASKEHRPRVAVWIHKELSSRRPNPRLLSDHFQIKQNEDEAEELEIKEWVSRLTGSVFEYKTRKCISIHNTNRTLINNKIASKKAME